MTHVLIVVSWLGGAVQGAAVSTQEFVSAESCNAARLSLMDYAKARGVEETLRGAIRPSFAGNSPYPPNRGRRESRMRAAPVVPWANCTKKAPTSIQVQRRQSDFPCERGKLCSAKDRLPQRRSWQRFRRPLENNRAIRKRRARIRLPQNKRRSVGSAFALSKFAGNSAEQPYSE